MDTAKIFKSGGSQAVRIPKRYQLPGDEVFIRKLGSAVILIPKSKAWELIDESMGSLPDFPERDQGQLQERDWW